MKIWIVIWWLCSISSSEIENSFDTKTLIIRIGEQKDFKMEASDRQVQQRISVFTDKEKAVEFAKKTKYRSDCSTGPAIVYELVKSEEYK